MHHLIVDGSSRPLMREVTFGPDGLAYCIACHRLCEDWPEATAAWALEPREQSVDAMVERRRRP